MLYNIHRKNICGLCASLRKEEILPPMSIYYLVGNLNIFISEPNLYVISRCILDRWTLHIGFRTVKNKQKFKIDILQTYKFVTSNI